MNVNIIRSRLPRPEKETLISQEHPCQNSLSSCSCGECGVAGAVGIPPPVVQWHAFEGFFTE